jgi:glyoxylase-like metal-dependent hydrolase (beta-lactamase superfamily II)
MTKDVTTIVLPLPYRLGSVNCYLIRTGRGFVLVDTGCSGNWLQVRGQLRQAGCGYTDLKLVVLTHGDFDHAGNAAHLRKEFGARIAMHRADTGMTERGDMFWRRRNGWLPSLIAPIAAILFGFGAAERLSPDLGLKEGSSFRKFGFDAKAVELPGHSRGSIGILTAGGDLYCGDLLESTGKAPTLNSILPDCAAGKASLDKLRSLGVAKVYPGHGKPFRLDEVKEGPPAKPRLRAV